MDNVIEEKKDTFDYGRLWHTLRRQNTGKICPLRSSGNKIVYCGCECAWWDPNNGCIIHRLRQI